MHVSTENALTLTVALIRATCNTSINTVICIYLHTYVDLLTYHILTHIPHHLLIHTKSFNKNFCLQLLKYAKYFQYFDIRITLSENNFNIVYINIFSLFIILVILQSNITI